MKDNELVYIDEYGLQGTNFYWHKYKAKGLHKKDIISAGLANDRVQVHKDIISPLITVNKKLISEGYTLFIKEGYRSKALYEIIYKRRVEKFGKEETDKILNMTDMPHSSGHSVDVALYDSKTNTEVYMRNGEDGTDALFIDYYKEHADEKGKYYQHLQETLIEVMQQHGFRLGTKLEYFHFDYRPDEPQNYPIIETGR